MSQIIGGGGGGGGISPAFSDITSATNTTAAMVVGTGSSLTTSGSGTLTANAFTGVLPLANGGRTLLNSQFASNTLTGDSTDQVIFTYTMPGATIAAGEGIRIWAKTTQTGATSTTYKINFGGTAMLSGPGAAAATLIHIIEIYNQPGVTNAQTLMGKVFQSTTMISGTYTDGAVDTTAPVVITLTFNVAATVTITGSRFWMVEIVH